METAVCSKTLYQINDSQGESTGKGGGEELLQEQTCICRGLNLWRYPVCILSLWSGYSYIVEETEGVCVLPKSTRKDRTLHFGNEKKK